MSFEEKISGGKLYNVSEVVVECRECIKADLERDNNLNAQRLQKTSEYEQTMVERYPHFANAYPSLFDMIIADPYDMPILDLMIEKLKNTSKRNLEKNTQDIIDLLAAKKSQTS